jgi:hypothetical protein
VLLPKLPIKNAPKKYKGKNWKLGEKKLKIRIICLPTMFLQSILYKGIPAVFKSALYDSAFFLNQLFIFGRKNFWGLMSTFSKH